MSDVFAIMSFKGSDVINGFEASSVVGARHDFIDFSGRGITSFGQVQAMLSGSASAIIAIGSGKTITLSRVAPTALTASDLAFSQAQGCQRAQAPGVASARAQAARTVKPRERFPPQAAG